MNYHEHVQCDGCGKYDFLGCRFKCLICPDYDLCKDCFDCGVSSGNHIVSHPMQCIWTRADLNLFFGGEDVDNPSTRCYTCPYCGELGLSETTLMEHVVSKHRRDGEIADQVLCPICACRPPGGNNVVITDLAAHLAVEHQIPSPPNIPARTLDVPPPTAAAAAATATRTGTAAVRNPQSAPPPSRRNSISNPNRTFDSFMLELISNLPEVSFNAAVNAGTVAAVAVAGPAAAPTPAPATIPVPTPSGFPNAQALQQLQLQLRQHPYQGRHQLEAHRFARRAFSGQLSPNDLPMVPGASTPNTSRNIGSGFNLTSEGRSNARTGGGTGRSAAVRTANTEFVDFNPAEFLYGNSNTASERPTNNDRGKFLLNKFLNQELSSSRHAQRDRDRADRSLFVQALLLSALSTDFDAEADGEESTIEDQLAKLRISFKAEEEEKQKNKIKKNKKKKQKQQKLSYTLDESSSEMTPTTLQVLQLTTEAGDDATNSTEV